MFMGELLLEEGCVDRGDSVGVSWCVERRFRVTEVFLAVLWVWIIVVRPGVQVRCMLIF